MVERKENIICFSGMAGSGKDTIADLLVSKNYLKIALADPLKRMAHCAFDFTIDQLWGPSNFRNEIDPRYGISPRDVLISLGDACRTLNEDIFIIKCYDIIKRCVEDDWLGYLPWKGLIDCEGQDSFSGYIIPDARRLNELNFFKNKGATIIRIIRPGAGLKTQHKCHATEMEAQCLPDNYFHHVIYNDCEIHCIKGKLRNIGLI